MNQPRRRSIGGLITVLLTAVAAAFMVATLMSSPARAQTAPASTDYPIPTNTGSQPAVVTEPPSTAKSALAFTGADIAGMMVGAAVVIGGGGGLVLVSRKRRQDTGH